MKAKDPVAPSSLIVWPATLVIVGASFTALTVTVNVSLAAAPPGSVTVRVIVDVPLWFAVGVTVTVRLAPLPPMTTAVLGISDVSVSYTHLTLPTKRIV